VFLLNIFAVVCLGQYNDGYHQHGYGGGHRQEPKKKPNPYKVLGVSKDATPAQVKRAYRRLGLLHHPDKNKDPDALKKMQEINDAYEMISDPDAKLIYDEFGDSAKFYDRWSYMQSRRGQELAKKDFYTSSEDVLTMELKTFYQTVRKKPFLVEFYAPWCVHCQEMVPKFKKAAVLLEGIVSLGAVNCEKHQGLCHQQDIQSYPTLKFFHPVERGEAQETEQYTGGHNPEDVYSWVTQSLSNELVHLTVDNFEDLVTNSNDLWLIDFSAGSWCGPCQTLKPHMRRLANSMREIAKVGIADCDSQRSLCEAAAINFYPAIKLFKKDKIPQEGELLQSENHNNPAVNMLNLFEIVARALHTPPVEAPEPLQPEGEEEARELDDDEIVDDVADPNEKTEL